MPQYTTDWTDDMRYVLALLLLAATNWISMNLGFEHGSDVGGCIAFDMMTDIPAKENPMCERAEKSALLPLRVLWVKITDN